jgi:hypothetical protein
MLDGLAVELDACREMGIAMFAGATRPPGNSSRSTTSWKIFLGSARCPNQSCRRATFSAHWAAPPASTPGAAAPYQCSFCTMINVQGRKSRPRSPDDVERLVRVNCPHGIHKFFITDDNFDRNKDWEAIFDRLGELKEDHGIPLGLLIQVDTLCHRIPNFVEKAKRAGVTRVFIGLGER